MQWRRRSGNITVAGAASTFKRYFTEEGVHPFDEVEWEIRDAVIPNYKEGGNAFEQREVEFPKGWSQNATNIVAQKYFRGPLGTPQRESSVRQMIGRVVDTITRLGREGRLLRQRRRTRGVFADELTHLLVHQKAAFNSPVWFNVGVPRHAAAVQRLLHPGRRGLDDARSSTGTSEEGTIFKGGSGSGINLSPAALVQGAARTAAGPRAARSASCAAPTPRPGRSSPAARPAAPPRWSC